MQLDCGNVGVMGLYHFYLNDVPVFEAPSKNLITDFGWNRLSNLTKEGNNTAQCQVGTSNTPPAITDTALGGLVASQLGSVTGVNGTGTDTIGTYTSSRITFAFALGAVVGNIAEVGFKVHNADASLTSRSLVKDGLGNPAVIVVTAADQLTVQYELRYYRAAVDVTGTVTVAGVPTTYTLRTAQSVTGTFTGTSQFAGLNFSQFPNFSHYGTGSVLGAPGVAVSGSATTILDLGVTAKVLTVNPTNTVVTFTTATIPVGSGNSSGGVVNLGTNFGDANGNYGAYGFMKVGFSPAIPKDATKTINYSFSITFNRL